MKNKWKRILSCFLVMAMTCSLLAFPGNAMNVQAAENSEFTLYYYYEGLAEGQSLYVDIWNHTGLEFGASASTSTDFGWTNPQGVFQAVTGQDNWYSIDLTIVDATVNEGFGIYAGNSTTKLVEYDNQWNNKEDYAILVGKTKTAYAIKAGTLYTDLSEVGLPSEDIPEVVYSLAELSELIATVPSDYASLGFTTSSVAGLDTALSTAKALVDASSEDAAAITEAYTSLQNAIAALSLAADIFVEKINNYDSDSIRGVDVSSYLSIMASFAQIREDMKNAGVSDEEIQKIGFKDWNGNVLDEQGFFDLLAASGVNYVRTRVWNDPYNSETGVGYGGGNNDVAAAKEIAQYVTNAGMKNLIDYHFSDFWADPGKQKTPKAWSAYSVDEKADAIAAFVTSSLTEIEKDGAKVSMVQIGNETNGKFCGESTWDNMNVLFDSGCDAVHAYNSEILAAVHFTNPESTGRLEGYAKNLNSGSVSYDVFATSYYPYWHGTMSNLTSVLTTIADTYDKYVMVAETSWANTYVDGDGHENTIKDSSQLGDYVSYNVTVQGQANVIRDVANAVNNVNVTLENGDKAGLGFFYWEPAWIPVQSVYDESGNEKENKDEIVEENKAYWETFGSGWAAEAASEYDPDDAGLWHGGSAVDNQSIFDYNGYPLASMNTFAYLTYGASASEIKADGYTCDEVELEVGQTVDEVLPATVQVSYNNNTEKAASVNWNAEDIAMVNEKATTVAGKGTYEVRGVLAEETTFEVVCKVTVVPTNLLDNPGFEDGTTSWTTTGSGITVASKDDPRNGTYSGHFYLASDFEFTLSNTVTVTEAGYYNASLHIQGLSSAGSREGENIVLTATTGDETIYTSKSVSLGGWNNWMQPEVYNIYISEDMISEGKNTITITLNATLLAESWGTIDDGYLFLKDTKPASIADCNVELDKTSYPYTGEAIMPEPVVKNGTTVLKKGTDYTLSYENNIELGEGKVVITGIGENYIGEKFLNFDIAAVILKDNDKVSVTLSENTFVADGSEKKPEVTVVYDGKTLEENKDYSVSYSNNVEAGNATVTVTGLNNYTDFVDVPFTITKKEEQTPTTETTTETTTEATTETTTEVTTETTTEAPSVTVGSKVAYQNANYEIKNVSTNGGAAGTVTYTGPTNKKSTKVTIPSTITVDGVSYKVTAIKAKAFYKNKYIKTVSIGKNVTSIGASAFSGCTKLKTVTIPATVNSIGSKAFYGDKKLTKITIKTTKLTSKKIGKNAFKGIPTSAKINVPNKKKASYKKLFRNCGLSKKVKVY